MVNVASQWWEKADWSLTMWHRYEHLTEMHVRNITDRPAFQPLTLFPLFDCVRVTIHGVTHWPTEMWNSRGLIASAMFVHHSCSPKGKSVQSVLQHLYIRWRFYKYPYYPLYTRLISVSGFCTYTDQQVYTQCKYLDPLSRLSIR